MYKIVHRIVLSLLVAIVFIVFITLLYKGMSYYNLNLEERVYHPDHALLKPSGIYGHGMGIIGSLLIIIGVGTYAIRKRYRIFSRMGLLKHWLEFHIFLCTLGPILVLFHTSYKFGGLVAISFWSMVAVFLSGIIGRFIYIQIPRTTEGRELSLNEVREMKIDVAGTVKNSYNLDDETYNIIVDTIKKRFELYHSNFFVRSIRKYFNDRKTIKIVKRALYNTKLSRVERKEILSIVRADIKLNKRIERLETMRSLFKYWHVAHLPFALVMLIIMIIHVGVTILFGYRWIF